MDDTGEGSPQVTETNGNGPLDQFVNGFNRLVRPFFCVWAFLVCVGAIFAPQGFASYDPVVKNIVWTIVTFWFGSRVVIKDIPAILQAFRQTK